MKWGNRVPAPVWAGCVVALLAWQVGMRSPGVGLDPSWNAGLAMGVHDGLHWGQELVFTYGPLGFLQNQLVWFSGQAVLSFLYSSLVFVIFCVGLVWALRRRLSLLVACLGAFVVVAVLPLLELSLLSAVFASFWLLEGGAERRSPRQLDAFVLGAAAFAGPAALIKLSTGPLVGIVLLVALIGARVGRRRVFTYLVVLFGLLLVLWLATGQNFGGIPDFVSHTAEISSGYSSAMLRSTEEAQWKVVVATLAAIGLTIALVAAAWSAPHRDRRGRWAATLLVGLAAFAIYKEGIVRVDAGHLTLYFANACVLWIAVGFVPGRRWAVPALALVIFVVSLPLRPSGAPEHLNAASNLRFAFDQARTLVSPGRRTAAMESGREGMVGTYALEPGALAALRGRTVAVEPWEAAAAWAYRLDWRPLPVFQNYSAYTSALDRLNAEAVEDPEGPERLLRENQQVVTFEFPSADLDHRFPGWDPPEQARAVLCNFAPLFTSERWQVLGRVPDRCGPTRELRTEAASAGEAVLVPKPRPDSVVYVRIDGAGVSGLERAQTFLYRANSRHLTVNDRTRYRLVPETAGDGLLLRAAPGVAAPGPFDPIPEAHTIAVDGGADHLTYSFYEVRLSSPRWSAASEGGDREAHRELRADAEVDRGVQQRVRARRVEAAVEAAHAAVEGDLLARRPARGARPTLDMECPGAGFVEDLPARVPEAVAPVEVLHVEPVALVEQPDRGDGGGAAEHEGPVDRVDLARLVVAELGRRVLGQRRPRTRAAADTGEVGEGRQRGGEGALAGVVELTVLAHQLRPDHPDRRVGGEPGEHRVEGPGVDLGVGVQQQAGAGLALPQDKVVGCREADVAAPLQVELGELARDHVRGLVGAAAVDHRHPHRRRPRWVGAEALQAAPQERFGAVADDHDLEVGRRIGGHGDDASRRLRRARSRAASASGSAGRSAARDCRGSRAPSPGAPRR
jgi:hypothetical protein